MKLRDLSTSDFVDALAGEAPAPGGGSAAAYAGAMAAGLCAMAARLTVGREKYRDAWPAMEAVIPAAERLRKRLLELMDADTEAYNSVVAAIKLPKGSDGEKQVRARAVQAATRTAAEVPLATLEAVAELAPLVEQVVIRGNANCISDVGAAAHLLQTAATAAAYNVRINIGSLRDQAFVEACRGRVGELCEDVKLRVKRAASEVESRLE